MAERFEKLYELQKRLYKRESPVIIEAGALLKDTVSDEILIQLNFHSVSDKKIKALKVIINVFDIMGNEIENKVEYSYLDLQISNGEYFGSKKAIMLPNKTIRSFKVVCYTVVYDDDTKWETGDMNDIKEIPMSEYLSNFFDNAKLIEQYSIETTRFAKYIPEQYEELWCCTCGELNKTEHCTKCNLQKELVFKKLDKEQIIHNLEVRLEREKTEKERIIREEKRRTEEIEQTKAAKQKQHKKYSILCGIAAVIIFIVCIVVSNINTNKTMTQIEKYIESNQYEHAFDVISTKNIGYNNRSKYIDEIVAGMREQFNEKKKSMEAVNVDGLMIHEFDNEIYYYDENGEKISLYKSFEPEMEYRNIRGVKVCYEGDRIWIPNDFMYSNGWIYFYEITDVFKSGEHDYSYTHAKRVNIETGNYETIDYNDIKFMGFYKLSDGRILLDDYGDLVFDPYKNKLIKNAGISNSEMESCIYSTDD